MKKLDIVVDMDGIICDLLTPWLAAYNKVYNDSLSIADCDDWWIENCVKPECGRNIYNFLTPNMFDDLLPIPGAIEAIKALKEAEHTIVILTSTVIPEVAAAKMRWVQKHTNIPLQDMFIGYRKSMVKADVFLDDSNVNHKKIREYHPEATILSIAYPYNSCSESIVDLNAADWSDPERAWNQIVEYIKELSDKPV